jgi:hypothetical protein
MSDLLAAADALVHSTGGVTVLEALARDCPVIAYGAPPGHARLTAKALVKQGLGQIACSPDELTTSLRNALERPRAGAKEAVSEPSCARLVLAATPRLVPERPLRSRLLRRAALACAALVLPCWAFSTDLPYALAASPLDLAPLNVVPTSQTEVGLVINAPPSMVPTLEAELNKHHTHASFAFSAPIDRKLLSSITLAHDEPLPALGSGEPMSWLGTRGQLKNLFTALRVRSARYYLAPPELTFGQYLLARWQGALPITGSGLDPGSLATTQGFRRGEVVVVDMGKRRPDAKTTLDELFLALARDHLSAVPVGQLLRSPSARGAG